MLDTLMALNIFLLILAMIGMLTIVGLSIGIILYNSFLSITGLLNRKNK